MSTETAKLDPAVEAEIKKLASDLKSAIDTVKPIAEKATAEMKAHSKLAADTKAASDEGLLKMNTTITEKIAEFETKIAARIGDVEQKLVRRGGGQQADERKTLGELIVENKDVMERLLGGPKKGTVNMSIETKTILSAAGTWGATASVTNSLVVPDRQGLIPLPMRQMTIRDLVAPGQTISNAIEYAVQVARTNNAAVVAENALKPSSNYTWDLRTSPVRTIAHLVKTSRQILDDAPALRSTIDAEMRYGLEFAEETELLNGDGTGAHILGMIPQATAYSGAFAITGETAIDRIRLAMLQGVLALYPMTGTVLNPTDWTKVELLKDGMGRYIIGDPQGTITPRLWGLPVVSSLAMTAGSFLVGAFKYACQIFDRMAIEILISTENNDDFEKNMLSIRGEERLAFIVKRPLALITGTLP
jgi:HK97 family phage major capsid protein